MYDYAPVFSVIKYSDPFIFYFWVVLLAYGSRAQYLAHAAVAHTG